MRDMRTYFVAVRSAAPDAEPGMSKDPVIQVASDCKPVTAVGVLTLVDANEVALSAPVDSCLTIYSVFRQAKTLPRSRHSSLS